MKIKKHVYKPGDEVWIIKPDFFIRCGYPLSYKMLARDYKYHPKLFEALGLFGLDHGNRDLNHRERDQLGDVLAKIAVRQREFGGPQRRIYTQAISGYQDTLVKVTGKLVVRTGDYYKPNTKLTRVRKYEGRLHMNGRGGLDNANSHVILKTEAGWIEARNVIPGFYRKLCVTDAGAKAFREANVQLPEPLQNVYAVVEPAKISLDELAERMLII